MNFTPPHPTPPPLTLFAPNYDFLGAISSFAFRRIKISMDQINESCFLLSYENFKQKEIEFQSAKLGIHHDLPAFYDSGCA